VIHWRCSDYGLHLSHIPSDRGGIARTPYGRQAQYKYLNARDAARRAVIMILEKSIRVSFPRFYFVRNPGKASDLADTACSGIRTSSHGVHHLDPTRVADGCSRGRVASRTNHVDDCSPLGTAQSSFG